jgi:hypothetical protein
MPRKLSPLHGKLRYHRGREIVESGADRAHARDNMGDVNFPRS